MNPGWKSLLPRPVRRFLRDIADRLPFEAKRRYPRYSSPEETERFLYQERYVRFDLRPGDRVVDIGSGGDPFPHASVLVERFPDPSRHRTVGLNRAGKPMVKADIHALPFADKSFEFVYCSHVLEHVDDPIRACGEIIRVGRRGYVETPSPCKDALFAWAKDMHRWHLAAIGSRLCFFEYTPRQLEGIRSSAWRDLIYSKWYHPLQEVLFENQDLFNVMFPWRGAFSVYVFRLDGTVETMNAGNPAGEP